MMSDSATRAWQERLEYLRNAQATAAEKFR
jgi:hypothetical protein